MPTVHKEQEICPLCEVGHLEFTSKDRVLRYNGMEKTLTDLALYQCTECGEGFYTDASKKKVNREFADLRRRAEGLLTSEEIIGFRKSYGLTQETLSGLLGMAPKTMARYESGFAIQSKQVDLMLRLLLKTPSNCRSLSEMAGISLPKGWECGRENFIFSPRLVPLNITADEFPHNREKDGDEAETPREYAA